MYAIIQTGGKQHRVAEGDSVRVEKLAAGVGATIRFTDVLLVADGEEVRIGTPRVDGAHVTAQVRAQDRARKVIVFKMKRRKGHRVKTGHRQAYTEVQITGIHAGSAAAGAAGAAGEAA